MWLLFSVVFPAFTLCTLETGTWFKNKVLKLLQICCSTVYQSLWWDLHQLCCFFVVDFISGLPCTTSTISTQMQYSKHLSSWANIQQTAPNNTTATNDDWKLWIAHHTCTHVSQRHLLHTLRFIPLKGPYCEKHLRSWETDITWLIHPSHHSQRGIYFQTALLRCIWQLPGMFW